MWRIKRRRTKPKENKAKTGVIYPKLNATAKPNRYVNRNTYLDVKRNKDKGAGCTIVGCQCSTEKHINLDYLISIDIFNEIGYCEPTLQLKMYGIIDAPCPPGTISPVNFLNLQIEQVSISWYWDAPAPDIEFDFQLSNTIENLNNYKIITNKLMLVFEKNYIQVRIPFNSYSAFSLISGYKFFLRRAHLYIISLSLY